MSEDCEQDVAEALARLKRDVGNLTDALGQLGVKPCSVCGKFYRDSNGSLFPADGAPVCYACFPSWWADYSGNLSTADRESIEFKITSWLIGFHRGRIFRDVKSLPPKEAQEIHLVVACRECSGTGAIGGGKCRYCLGNGTVWLIAPRKGWSIGE